MKLNYTNGLREKDGEPWYFPRIVSLINSVDSWTTALLKMNANFVHKNYSLQLI